MSEKSKSKIYHIKRGSNFHKISQSKTKYNISKNEILGFSLMTNSLENSGMLLTVSNDQEISKNPNYY
jgi:hypothetical protein